MIKKNQIEVLELKKYKAEMKISLERLNSRFKLTEELANLKTDG